jgi:hypothetical protein
MKICRLIATSSCVATLLLAPVLSQAAGPVSIGNKKIVTIGCHNVDPSICYVSVDSKFNALYCDSSKSGPTDEIRWDNADTVMGRRTYASLLVAHLAGKTVNIVLSGACTLDGFPAIQYFRIID